MIDLEAAFAALPPPGPAADDAAQARRILLRARVAAALANETLDRRWRRLRLASALLAVVALDVAGTALVAAAAAPLAAACAALAVIHAGASLALLGTAGR